MIDCKIQTGVDVSHIRLVVKVPTDPRFTLIEINVNEACREAKASIKRGVPKNFKTITPKEIEALLAEGKKVRDALEFILTHAKRN